MAEFKRLRGTKVNSAAALAALILLAAVPGSAQQSPVVVAGDLAWALTGNGESASWNDAEEYCETLALNGRNDWRLPTLLELETLYDPSAEGRIRAPFSLDDCCLWSSTSLAELEAETKGVLPGPTNDSAGYYWGFLFPSGVRYYSFGRFPDGQALCVRDEDGS